MIITQEDIAACKAIQNGVLMTPLHCNKCKYNPHVNPFYSKGKGFEAHGRTVCFALFDYKLCDNESQHHTFYLE